MTRPISLISFLALAISSVAAATLSDVRARDIQEIHLCGGTWVLASRGPACGTQWYRHVAETDRIHSIKISPDPPEAGKELRVTVSARSIGKAPEAHVSSRGDCSEWR